MGFVRLGLLSAEALERILRNSNGNKKGARLALVESKASEWPDCREGRASGGAIARDLVIRAKK